MEHLLKFKQDLNYKTCPKMFLDILVLQLFSLLLKTGVVIIEQ